jgi:hypothetical protein
MNIHRTDKLSLVFGVIFLGFVLVWLFGSQLDVDLPTAGWFIAGGLILFGVLGLMGSIRPRRRPDPVSTPPAPAPEDW